MAMSNECVSRPWSGMTEGTMPVSIAKTGIDMTGVVAAVCKYC